MPTLTQIVGVPTLPVGASNLKLMVILDPPYQGGPAIGLSAAEYAGVWNGNAWVFDTVSSAPMAIPMARQDIQSPAPEGWLRAIITYTQNGIIRRTEPKNYRPIANSGGVLDLSVNQSPVAVVATQDIQALINQAQSNTQQITAALAGLSAAQAAANAAQASATAAAAQAQAKVSEVDEALDLLAFATAVIPPAIDAANQAAEVARAAAATLPCPPVRDDAARVAFFASHSGDVSCIQMDTLHVWQRYNGVISDLGPNSLAVADGVKSFASLSQLANAFGPLGGLLYSLRGTISEGDGGAGLWVWVNGPRPAEDNVVTKWHASRIDGYFSRFRDGFRATLAWAGLSAYAGAAAITTALAALAGLEVFIDKMYVITSNVTIPASTTIVCSPFTGFQGDGVAQQLLTFRPGSAAHDLNVDGKKAVLSRNSVFDSFVPNALIRSEGTLEAPVRLININAKNAPGVVVFGYEAHATMIRNGRIDGACGIAVYFQMSDDVDIDGLWAKNLQLDGFKVHSKDDTVQNAGRQIRGPRADNMLFDYSNVDLTGDALAWEVWGGQTAFVNSPSSRHIRVIGPRSVTGGAFYGISADTCKGGSVNDFVVDGGVPAMVTIGIEAAGCVDFTYDVGEVIRWRYTGCSLSQPNTKNIKVRGVTFRDAYIVGTDTVAIQWYNGISGGEVSACTFKDAGARYLFFNGAGSDVKVLSNHFLVSGQVMVPKCIFVSGSPQGVQLVGNDFGPTRWAGDAVSTTAYANPGELAGALNWLIGENVFDALKPDGTYGGGGLAAYGSGGGHTFAYNRSKNHTGPFIGQSDTGPASVFTYNRRADGGPAEYARAGIDSVITHIPPPLDTEGVRDAVAAMMVGGPGIQVDYDDAGDKLKLTNLYTPKPGRTDLPRLTGGTLGNFVIQVGNAWVDADSSMVREMGVKKVCHLGLDNIVRDSGLAEGFSGLRGSEVVYITQPGPFQSNWNTYPAGQGPVTSLGFAEAAVGVVVSPGSFLITPTATKTTPNIDTILADDLSTYTTSAATNAAFSQPWKALGGSGHVEPNGLFDTGRVFDLYTSDDDQWYAVTKTSLGMVLHDNIQVQLRHGGNSTPTYLTLRTQGGIGTETAVFMKVDQNNALFTLGYLLNGVETTLATYYLGNFTLNDVVNAQFAIIGTRMAGRLWLRGAAKPEWQLDAYLPVNIGVGYAGLAAKKGEIVFSEITIWRNSSFNIPPIFKPTPYAAISTWPTGGHYDRYLIGDSLTDNGAYARAMSAGTTLNIITDGIVGQGTYEIAGRAGAYPAVFTFPNNTIPGDLSDTPITKVGGPDLLADSAFKRQRFVTMAGVFGVLTHLPAGYSFQRIKSGPQVVLDRPVPAIVDTSGMYGRVVLIWAGRNSLANAYAPFTETGSNYLLIDIRAIYNAALAAGGIPVVLSILNSDQAGERKNDATHAAYDKIIGLNNALASLYPGRFIDVRSALAAPNAATTDIIPANLRYDYLHLNAAGYAAMTPIVNAALTSMGLG